MSAPPVVESRPLKASGLALAAAGGGGLGYVVQRAIASAPVGLGEIAFYGSLALLAANAVAIGCLLLRAGFGEARALRHRRAQRAVALQLLAGNAVAPAMIWMAVTDDPAVRQRLEASGWDTWPEFLILILAVVAWRLWRRSRRHEAISADEAMAIDPRPPVLYLRSFRDDGEPFVESRAGWILRAGRASSPEEHMAAILGRIGPVIAIGKPGEPLPELGAARLYVSHDQWQQRVTELMQRARLVVVRLGSSPGVLWEIEQALAHLPRQRLVLAVLGAGGVAPELVAHLSPVLGSTFDDALPEAAVRGWRMVVGSRSGRRLGGLIYFAPDGTARAVPVQRLEASALRPRDLMGKLPVHRALERAWDEILPELGLDAPQRTWRGSRLWAVALALLLGAFGAHWFYLGNRRRGWIYVATFPLLLAPVFLSAIDALRFILADHAGFQSRYVATRAA